MAANPHVVNATARQRLGAKFIDAAPVLLTAVLVLGGDPGPAAGENPGPAFASVAVMAAAAYGVWLWLWEARTGKTPGNLAAGIRTTDEAGHAPGLLGTFLHGMLLILSAVTVAGPLVLLISNIWDSNGQRQGWHDKAAHTLSVDVRAGRNPLTTGGLLPFPGAAGAVRAAGASGGSGASGAAGPGWLPPAAG